MTIKGIVVTSDSAGVNLEIDCETHIDTTEYHDAPISIDIWLTLEEAKAIHERLGAEIHSAKNYSSYHEINRLSVRVEDLLAMVADLGGQLAAAKQLSPFTKEGFGDGSGPGPTGWSKEGNDA